MINILKVLDYSCTGEKEYANFKYKINLNFLKDDLYFLIEDNKNNYNFIKEIIKDLTDLGTIYPSELFSKEDFKITSKNIANMSYFESEKFVSLASKFLKEDLEKSYIIDFKTNEKNKTFISLSLELTIKDDKFKDDNLMSYAFYIRDNYLFYNTKNDITSRVFISLENDLERTSANYNFIINKSIVKKKQGNNFFDEYINMIKEKTKNRKSNCKLKINQDFIHASGIISSRDIENK